MGPGQGPVLRLHPPHGRVSVLTVTPTPVASAGHRPQDWLRARPCRQGQATGRARGAACCAPRGPHWAAAWRRKHGKWPPAPHSFPPDSRCPEVTKSPQLRAPAPRGPCPFTLMGRAWRRGQGWGRGCGGLVLLVPVPTPPPWPGFPGPRPPATLCRLLGGHRLKGPDASKGPGKRVLPEPGPPRRPPAGWERGLGVPSGPLGSAARTGDPYHVAPEVLAVVAGCSGPCCLSRHPARGVLARTVPARLVFHAGHSPERRVPGLCPAPGQLSPALAFGRRPVPPSWMVVNQPWELCVSARLLHQELNRVTQLGPRGRVCESWGCHGKHSEDLGGGVRPQEGGAQGPPQAALRGAGHLLSDK